jgi:hypothetical protein
MIKSRRMRLAEYVWKRRGMHARFWWGSHEEGDYQEDLDVSRRILLRWTLEK